MNSIWLNAVRASQAAALDPDALTLFAAMTVQPNETRKTLISDTIKSLKAAGVWSLLDAVWFMAAHDEQASRLNWKAPASFTLATAGTITFTLDRGWQGDGSSGYLDTGWIPATHGVNYQLNDASFGVYSRTDYANDAHCDIGARSATNTNMANLFIRRSTTNSEIAYYTNQNIFSLGAHSLSSTGLYVARRTASNAAQAYRNGSSIATNTSASTGLAGVPFFIAANNNNGTAGAATFTTRQYALAFTAAAMSAAQQLALYNTTQAYMTAVGAAV
jgi:hypothetical protein